VLIVADESMANLDPNAACRILRAIREYVDTGGVAVVIEHGVDLDHVVAAALDIAEAAIRHACLPAELPPQQQPEPFEGTVLRYRDAELGYGTTTDIYGLTRELGAGQRIAALVPNGACTTTPLRASVGMVELLCRSVELRDRLIAHLSSR
jgi:ABC-type branched-subunit amino acid transport system ATPase component